MLLKHPVANLTFQKCQATTKHVKLGRRLAATSQCQVGQLIFRGQGQKLTNRFCKLQFLAFAPIGFSTLYGRHASECERLKMQQPCLILFSKYHLWAIHCMYKRIGYRFVVIFF